MLIDTHAHLYWDSYREDFDQVIQRSKEAGVTTIINVGVNVEKSIQAVQVSEKLALSGLVVSLIEPVEGYSTIGIHPHEVLRLALLAQDKQLDFDVTIQEDINKLEQIYKSNPRKVIGVGECGMDFLFESNPDWIPNNLTIEQYKQLQKQLFQAQIDLAKKLGLPLIVHCRDDRTNNPNNTECWDEVIKMTKDWYGIYHCYSGLLPTTNYILQTNFLVSFAANITYPKNDYLLEAAKFLPLEKICLETDSPFLSPQSKRGQRNEPSSVKEIAEFIAELKGVSFEEVANKTTENVKLLFKLRLH